jgi:hypothetical protein
MAKFTYALLAILTVFAFIEACKHSPDPVKIPDPNVDPKTNIPCVHDTVYFTEVQQILNSACQHTGCHNSFDKEEGVILTDFLNVISTGGVVPGDPMSSILYQRINHAKPDSVMPPFPYITLLPEQIQRIKTWIQQGAQNNYCDGCDTMDVSFSGSIRTLINNTCYPCHNNDIKQGLVNLSDYDKIKYEVDSGLLLRSVEREPGDTVIPMPYLQSKFDDCKIRLLQIWIDDGAPNN